MSTPPQDQTSQPQGQGGSPQQKTEAAFTQEQLNAILAEDRRKNAAKYSDYETLKQKAAERDALEEASKSEMQKAIDRAAAAEKERDALKAAEAARQEREAKATQAKAWIEAAAKKYRVPADAIRGNTEEEINAHAEALSALVPPKGYVPNEGERPPGDGTSELRDFTRQLFSKE